MPLSSRRTDARIAASEAEARPQRGLAPLADAEERLRFDDFYSAQAQFVARSLRRLGIRDELLDDALQEVFLIIYRKLPELRGDEHVKTWVFRISMNVAANLRRQTQRWHRKLGGGTDALPERSTGADDQLTRVLNAEKQALLYRVLDTLDDDKRSVFVLHELEQLSVPDVADALEINLNTAYSRLRAARAAFERGVQQLSEAQGDLE